ncbi:LOW QUALITY PROTEIN: glutamate-rich protein 3 [Ctenodactylus gundi]
MGQPRDPCDPHLITEPEIRLASKKSEEAPTGLEWVTRTQRSSSWLPHLSVRPRLLPGSLPSFWSSGRKRSDRNKITDAWRTSASQQPSGGLGGGAVQPSSHLGAQKKKGERWRPFPVSPGSVRTLGAALSPPLATGRLWIPRPAGGGPGGCGLGSRRKSRSPQGPPQRQATPPARLGGSRPCASGLTHPPAAPAEGSTRDPAEMSHSHPAGLLAAYNSLTDKHLAGYFNNTRIRRHLLRSGLITRSGRILSEKEYKLSIMKQDHQKYIRECLAQAIFHKVLDMERYHQLEIKKKLEALARKERIQRFKGEHTRQSIESNMPVLSPHPPIGPKTNRGYRVLVGEEHSGPLTLTAPRPYTAPGNMRPPFRLQPLSSNPAVKTVTKITSGTRSKTSLLENEAPFPIGGKKAMMKFRNSKDKVQTVNPYQLPSINRYLTPVPPPPLHLNGKATRDNNRSETGRRRRFRPTTAPNGLEPLFTRDAGRTYKTSLHSNAAITMIYLGKNVHLTYDDPDFRDEIRVYQQHCGGENLCVYKGKLLEKETFQFISKRHHGFPFSLTFFLNGMQVNRLSSCCEYKHRKGSRLGGKGGYFGFVCVERASPCYKCIIAMGLDKKYSTKSRREKSMENREALRKGEGKLKKDRRRNEMEEGKICASALYSTEEIKTGVREVKLAIEEMENRGQLGQDIWEDSGGNPFKYEYEEDFEVDEEKRDEKANEEGQAYDQMNGISKSPSEDEKNNLSPEKESEILSKKAPDASDNVKEESDGCSEREPEGDIQDIKTASSTSSRSYPYSSDSDEDFKDGDRESETDNSTDECDRSSSQEPSENDEPRKSRDRIKKSSGTETEDEEAAKADVETQPPLRKPSCESVPEEDVGTGTQGSAEDLSEKSRKHAFGEETKSKHLEVRTTEAKDKKAGLSGVTKGVGQIISEALAPSSHCRCDAEVGVCSADDRGTPMGKPETDTGGAPSKDLVVEERAAHASSKEFQRETLYTLETKEATTGGEIPQREDADPVVEKADTAQEEKAEVDEVPLGVWEPTAEEPASGEQSAQEMEISLGLAGATEAEEEGDRRPVREGLPLTGNAAARASVSLSGDAAPGWQALLQRALETEKAASEEPRASGKVELASTTLGSEPLPGGQAPTPEVREPEEEAAEREAGSQAPGTDETEEDEHAEPEDMRPEEGAASEEEGGSEEAVCGGEEPAREKKEAGETGTPLAGESPVGTLERSPEERPREGAARQGTVSEPGSAEEDGREERLPEEPEVAREERRKAERPEKPPRETGSETEVTRASTLTDGAASEEEKKLSGREANPPEETVSEEQPQTEQNQMQLDAEDVDPTKAPETTEGAGLLEKSMEERVVSLPEAGPEIEKSSEKATTLRKGGGRETPREAGDTEHKGRAEAGGQRSAAPSEQEEGTLEGSGGDPEMSVSATAEAKAGAAQNLDGFARAEERTQGPEGVEAAKVTQEDVPEEDPTMEEKCSEEAEDEHPEEERDDECTLRTGPMEDSSAEGSGATGRGQAAAEEGVHPGEGVAGTAAGRREVLAEAKTAQGERVANTAAPLSDDAGEETQDKEDEDQVLRKVAAAESREEGPGVEEGAVAFTTEAAVGVFPEPSEVSAPAPQLGQDGGGGKAETTQPPRSAGEEKKTGSGDGEGQMTGTAEGFRGGSPEETEAGPPRESLEAGATLPAKPGFSGTQKKQQPMVQGERECADVPLNSTKD